MSEKHPEDPEAPETPKRKTSPADLGDRGHLYLESLWEELYLGSDTAEAWAANLAELVHHARHLRPEDHAELAEHIRTPFKRPRGRTANNEGRKEIWNKYFCSVRDPHAPREPRIPRHQAIEEIANEYGLSHEAAAKRYDQAGRGPHPLLEEKNRGI